MSDREVLFIFYYDGDFQFDISRSVHSGGKQKMKYLSTDISYQCLANKAIKSSNWDTTIQNLSMQYLYHNERAFSMVSIDDDKDVRLMFKASGNETNEIYLYISNGLNNNESIGGERTEGMPTNYITKFHIAKSIIYVSTCLFMH